MMINNQTAKQDDGKPQLPLVPTGIIKAADEMNKEWSPCTTCAFSDCDKDSDVCMECDDRSYKENDQSK